jgi:hypothetical protein
MPGARLSRRVGGVPAPWWFPFLAVGAVCTGQPGAKSWRRVKALVIRVAQGQWTASRSRSRRPLRVMRPATVKIRSRRRARV